MIRYVILILFFITACAAPEEQTFSIRDKYTKELADTSKIKDIPNRWWEIFKDDELNGLVAEALKNNPDINQTRKRLEQAASLAKKSYADLFPIVTAAGERSDSRSDTSHSHEFSLAGAASYELDIWGRNRAGIKKDELEAQASLEDLRTAAITLSASVVENWLRLKALGDEEELLNKQVETNRTIFELQQQSYANGGAKVLDVLQQKEVLAKAIALLPDIQSEKELVTHQLAVLIGKTPSEKIALKEKSLPKIIPLPEAGLPSKLLSDRPDIVAAWLRAQSGNWAAAAARLDRLPAFTLSANYSTSSVVMDSLFNSWLLNLAAGVAIPVIDGGSRRAEAVRQEALADERFLAYKAIVIGAITEVEDALTRNYYQDKKISSVRDQLDISRASLEQAQTSYASGNASYINVLNGLLNVQSLERELVQSERDLALYRVELYRAMGLKGWTDELIKEQKSG